MSPHSMASHQSGSQSIEYLHNSNALLGRALLIIDLIFSGKFSSYLVMAMRNVRFITNQVDALLRHVLLHRLIDIVIAALERADVR
jgi:hypothetical protein